MDTAPIFPEKMSNHRSFGLMTNDVLLKRSGAYPESITEKIPHGDIWIGFTPDEEVGSGADLFDLDYFKARFAYTVDGDYEGEVAYENFNAASASFEINGVNVHPRGKRYYDQRCPCRL